MTEEYKEQLFQGLTRGNYCAKYERFNEIRPEDTISLSVADSCVPVPPPIANAITKRAERLTYGYTNTPTQLIPNISTVLHKRHGVKFTPEEIILSINILFSLSLCVQTLTKEDEDVLTLEPCYGPFRSIIHENNRRLHEFKYGITYDNSKYGGKLEFDMELFRSTIETLKPKLFMFVNPHNPVFTCFSVQQLQEINDICVENGVALVSDEIHIDLCQPDVDTCSMMSINPDHIVLQAPSKTYGVPGLLLSYITTKNARYKDMLYSEMKKLHLQYAFSPFAYEAALAAYTDECEMYRHTLIEYYMEQSVFTKDFILERLPESKIIMPQGSFLLHCDLRAYIGDRDSELEVFLVDEYKLAVTRGSAFGPSMKGCMRINLSCGRTTLIEGLTRMTEGVLSFVAQDKN
ncbi:hypothetical protein PCE1_001662 [Barthelona sp. PCE]